MNGSSLRCMLVSVVVFTFSAGVSANGGVIHFNGQVVNTGCAVQPLSESPYFKALQPVRVTSEITLAVDTYRNACSGDVIPFNTAFTALSSSGAVEGTGLSLDKESRVGVVTLTYQ
jgi:type 1 fimbria pilin